MSLEEKRNDNSVYLRPLRELISKEIAFYNHFKIYSTNTSILNLPNSTIYRLL